MTLPRRWTWWPPFVLWLLGGLGYLLGWRVAGFVLQGLSLALFAAVALFKSRRERTTRGAP